jgi:hypothetical protein
MLITSKGYVTRGKLFTHSPLHTGRLLQTSSSFTHELLETTPCQPAIFGSKLRRLTREQTVNFHQQLLSPGRCRIYQAAELCQNGGSCGNAPIPPGAPAWDGDFKVVTAQPDSLGISVVQKENYGRKHSACSSLICICGALVVVLTPIPWPVVHHLTTSTLIHKAQVYLQDK